MYQSSTPTIVYSASRTCATVGKTISSGGIAPGCWYPAELPVAARDRILAVVEEGAIVWEV